MTGSSHSSQYSWLCRQHALPAGVSVEPEIASVGLSVAGRTVQRLGVALELLEGGS